MPLQMYYRRISSPPLPHPQQFSVMAELSSFSPSTHRFPIKLKAISRQDVFQITRELDHMNLNLLQLAVTSSKRNTKHRSCSGGGSVITRHQSCGSGDSLHTLGRSSENGGLVALPQFWPDQRCWHTCDMRRGVATRSRWKIANPGFSFDTTN